MFSDDFEPDVIPVNYLFRTYPEMPLLERKALQLARGKTLDVGCCAGSHALYLQNIKKLPVKAIDLSEGAIEIAKLRGVHHAAVQDFFKLKNEKFHTILLMMNGTGVIGKMRHMTHFFEKIREILKPNGQVLLDSSDLSYLYDREEDRSFWKHVKQSYYGEFTYKIGYKGRTSPPFDWLYIDFKTLKSAALAHGFSCEKIEKGPHYDYLALLRFY